MRMQYTKYETSGGLENALMTGRIFFASPSVIYTLCASNLTLRQVLLDYLFFRT